MTELFCLCRKPDDGRVMIQCNDCKEWYHLSCVNIDQDDLASLIVYYCPGCTTGRGAGVSSPPSKRRDTKETKTLNAKVKSKGKLTVENENISKEDLHARETVKEGFCHALKKYWEEWAGDKGEEELSLNALCESIEEALFSTFATPNPTGNPPTRCGTSYRTKYRSLQFNLKDPKNPSLRASLFTGTLSPQKLVNLSAADMANEDIHKMAETVRKESLTNSVLHEDENGNGGVYVKKTHKGEDYLPMSPVDEHTHSPPTPPLTSSLPNDNLVEDQPVWWMGKLYFPDMGRYPAVGHFITSASLHHRPTTWHKLMPHNLHISGRIQIPPAMDYIKQVWSGSMSRDVLLFALWNPANCPAEGVDYVIDHLRNNARWAVIAHDPTRGLRDFYIAGCRDEGEAAQILPEGALREVRKWGMLEYPLLFGLMVVAKDGRKSTNTMPPNVSTESYDPQNHSMAPSK